LLIKLRFEFLLYLIADFVVRLKWVGQQFISI
jgi:hypothetical protein